MEELNQENNIKKVGYMPAFPLISMQDVVSIANELGLSASQRQLSLLRERPWKESDRYTFDEIYTVDAYLCKSQAYYDDIRVHSVEIENAQTGKAFADLISKQNALGKAAAPSLDELPEIYNSYLKASGFDPSREEVAVIPTAPLADTRSVLTQRIEKIVSRDPDSPFALAKVNGAYRFNADKKKTFPSAKASSPRQLICVKLPDEEFAWKELCEKIDRSVHMSADISLAIPVGKGGILSALDGCGCSYTLDAAGLSALFGKEVRPFELTEAMSALIIITYTDTALPMLNALQKWGYTACVIGVANNQGDYLSVPYGGIFHTVSYGVINFALTPRMLPLSLTSELDVETELSSDSNEKGMLRLSFDSLGFNALFSRLETAISEMAAGNSQNHLALAFCLPVEVLEDNNRRSIAVRLAEFLAIYNACALHAIPITAHLFPRCDKKEVASVWLYDESVIFES